jgi:hypothetical protein
MVMLWWSWRTLEKVSVAQVRTSPESWHINPPGSHVQSCDAPRLSHSNPIACCICQILHVWSYSNCSTALAEGGHMAVWIAHSWQTSQEAQEQHRPPHDCSTP